MWGVMADFALVVFSEEKAKTTSVIDGIINFFKKMPCLFKKHDLDLYTKKVELYQGLNAYIVKLPYSVEEFRELRPDRLKRIISETGVKIGTDNCILPCFITQSHGSKEAVGNSYDGGLLYKSLLLNILEEVYSKSRLELSDLEIAVAQGEGNAELFAFVRLLSSRVKYITVLVNDRSSVEGEVNRIFADLGLSIGLTADYRNGLKNTDIVVNLGGIAQFSKGAAVNTKALVVNYCQSENLKAFSGNIVVNGVQVGLPGIIRQKIDNYVFEYFNIMEISEIVLLNKLGFKESIVKHIDVELMEMVSREFKRDGFEITGFKGRHSILDPEQIEISVSKKRQ